MPYEVLDDKSKKLFPSGGKRKHGSSEAGRLRALETEKFGNLEVQLTAHKIFAGA